MAGASSTAGYVNIETTETSNRPEIESGNNLQAVEATADFDEVRSLDKKKCDNTVEQDCANETEKPKPPASKRTYKGLSEVADDSEWYHALEDQNCKALMDLLQANPCLVTQTGPRGWTVLHVAAQRGCLQLLYHVFGLFQVEDQDHFVDEMSGVKVYWKDLIKAKCEEFKAEVSHIAWFTCPRLAWQALLSSQACDPGFLSIMTGPNCEISQQLRDKLIGIINEEIKKTNVHLRESYQFDLNYNFVDFGHEELQFHYACQDLSRRLAEDVICRCLDLGPFESIEILMYLLKLHNAQGQTPFHVAASCGYISEFLKLLRREDADYYEECLNAKDVRGWTVLHYAVATGDHEGLKTLLEDERIDANARTSSIIQMSVDESIEAEMTALHLAILHNDVRSVELLLQCPRIDINALFKRYIVCGYERIRPGDDYDEISERRSYWSPLQLAAIMGLSDVIRALLVLKPNDIYDAGKLENNITVGKNF